MQTCLNYLRRRIVESAFIAKEGHIPSAFSVLDILWVLYNCVMKHNFAEPRAEDRDRLILSKGHASLALYAVLADSGYFDNDELSNFCKYSSRLGGHPDCLKVPGVEASTGSLGHGLPMAIGIAFALRLKRIPGKVFVIIGDGECNEGTIWESALLGSNHGLDSITCIVDNNHSTDRALNMGSLAKKFLAFDWHVIEVNGHDHVELEAACRTRIPGKPIAIVADTIKGKGVARMEGNPAWHHASPKTEDYLEIMQELA